jgi:hypothetical protein
MAEITERILWTALPNGLAVNAEGKQVARISVYVSPRLRGGTKLNDFSDFLNWPEQMKDGSARFKVEIDSGELLEARIASDPPDTDLWLALFGPQTPVRTHTFDDYADRPIVSISNSVVLDYLKGVYGKIASGSPDDLPRIAPEGVHDRRITLAGVLDTLVKMQTQALLEMDDEALTRELERQVENGRIEARRRRMENQRGGALIEPDIPINKNDPLYGFAQSMLFHYRSGNAKPVDLPASAEEARAQFTEQIDFHQMLSALNNYPTLMRRLGLVIDLEVDAELLPKTPGEQNFRKMSIRPGWRPTQLDFTPEEYSLWTVYRNDNLLGTDLFMAVSHSKELSGGLWTPKAADLDLVQMDVDGAVLKLLNTATTIASQTHDQESLPLDSPQKDGIPALRSKGVSLVLSGRAGKINERFNRSLNLNDKIDMDPPKLDDLFAEDLLRGYQLDVFDQETGDWLSLHHRTGTYQAANYLNGTITIQDEGFVQPSITEPPRDKNTPPDPSGEIYVHESLFTWDGWSLSVPRMGKSLSRSPRAPEVGDEETQPQNIPNTAMTAMQLEVHFSPVPGTLPRLRFQRQYKFRVRTVDLAGNSLKNYEAEQLLQAFGNKMPALFPKNDALIYGRFEPVGAPELIARQVFGEGESVERMVIRSNFDQTTEEYSADHPAYLAFNDRHVAPPKASQHLVETHGMLDGAFNARRQNLPEEQANALAQDTYLVSVKEKGSLNDQTPDVILVRTGGSDDTPQVYAVHTEEQLVLPYLPDPWSAGAVFLGLPGVPENEAFVVKWDGPSWHELSPFRIRLMEGNDPPVWDGDNHLLTIQLEKGRVASVRISSLFGGEVRGMGLWHWLEQMAEKNPLDPPKLAELEPMIMNGRHWMFTPFRRLALVHAVQQPLSEPRIGALSFTRNRGDTAAQIVGEVKYHSPSSAKLDLLASWMEWQDDVNQPGPETKQAQAHVLDLPASFDGLPGRLTDPLIRDVLQLVDEGVLLTFTTKTDDSLHALQNMLGVHNLSADQKRRIFDLINLVRNLKPHEFGDTKYRKITYHFDVTSRFREYYAPAITQDPANLTRSSEEITVEMLSTGHPAAPHLLYVIPTYGWKQSTNNGTITSTRRGGGLRIYLDRPWYSSGAGELLGVVVSGQLPNRWEGLDDNFKPSTIYPYDTYWGDDPMWIVQKIPLPSAADFRNAVAVGKDIRLIEKPDTRVTIYGHEVFYDNERQLWYCDLNLNTAEFYAPFIRLALVRYQPNSLANDPGDFSDNLHVSAVVTTEIVQTAPNRTLTITRLAGEGSRLMVSLTGPAPLGRQNPPPIQGTNLVTITLEKRSTDIPDETLGWQPFLDLEGKPLPEVELGPTPQIGGVMLWTGKINIPADAAGETLRLVAKEFEPFTNFTPDLVNGQYQYGQSNRLVYMDIVGIDNN